MTNVKGEQLKADEEVGLGELCPRVEGLCLVGCQGDVA